VVRARGRADLESQARGFYSQRLRRLVLLGPCTHFHRARSQKKAHPTFRRDNARRSFETVVMQLSCELPQRRMRLALGRGPSRCLNSGVSDLLFVRA